jgi:hypothetical protein
MPVALGAAAASDPAPLSAWRLQPHRWLLRSAF